MTSLILQFGAYLAALAGVAIVALAGLSAFRAWIALERAKLDLGARGAPPVPIAARIDVADLKERVRRLEAIASGVDI
jgi:hypothetical protein